MFRGNFRREQEKEMEGEVTREGKGALEVRNSSSQLNKQVLLIALQLEHSSEYHFILHNINI